MSEATYSIEQLAEMMLVYIDAPVAFVRDILHAEPDPWQEEGLNALVDKGRLAVRAGHGVGKSAFEAWAILWFLFTRPYPKVVATAPTRQQLYDILWAEIAKWMEKAPILKQYFEWQKTRIVMVQAPERWWASARTASKPENFAGIHEEHVLIVCDEASGIRDAIYEVAEGALTTPDAKLILCGNPTQLSGEFFEAFHKRRHLYHTMKVSCIGSPRVTQDYIDNLKQKYGEKSQVYRVRVLGEFPEREPDVFIPLEIVEAATLRDVHEVDREGNPILVGPIHIGCDIARYGGDEIVFYPRVGLHVFEPEVHYSQSTTETTGQIIRLGMELLKQYPRPNITITIDVGAMGAGVVDQLVDATTNLPGDWTIVPVNFGGAGDEECDDMATAMWKNARDILQGEEIHLPNDEKTIAQLSTRKYKITPKGKFKIESKDDYKKRHEGESPDRADALVLCLWGKAVQESQSIETVDYRPATAGIRRKVF